MLHVNKVEKSYEENKAVSKISFSVNPGEIVGIIGPNGAGKTTLLKMVCGLLQPDAGSITVAQVDVQSGPDARKEIGYVPEDSPVYDDMAVEDYLGFFGSLYDIPKATIKKRSEELLTALDFTFLSRELGNLSKGMKRKVMIARSLLHDPNLLVYDEPASGLDPTTTHTIVEYIRDLKKKEKAILLSGHNLYQMEQLCDRILFVKGGKVLFDGPVSELKKQRLKQTVQITYKKGSKTSTILIESGNLDASLKDLMKKGVTILNIHSIEGTLEAAFLKLTK